MVHCIITCCQSNSRNVSKKNFGVTFHHFPRDPERKFKWAGVVGRRNWMPSKHDTVCSRHFKESDFYVTKGGLRRLHIDASPSLNLTSVTSVNISPNLNLSSVTSVDASSSLNLSTSVNAVDSASTLTDVAVLPSCTEIADASGIVRSSTPNSSSLSSCTETANASDITADICPSSPISSLKWSGASPSISDIDDEFEFSYDDSAERTKMIITIKKLKTKVKQLKLLCEQRKKSINRLHQSNFRQKKKIAKLENVLSSLQSVIFSQR